MLPLLALGACNPESPLAVDLELDVDVPGATLHTRVRGADPDAPVLLVIHGGPGYAMLDLFHTALPASEDEFIVVSYDQRGAGRSYDADLDLDTMTLDRFVADADAVRIAALDALDRDEPVYVVGHSMGTMIGLELAGRDPAVVAAYIGVGQVVNVVENEQASWDWAREQAVDDENEDAIAELDCVGRPTEDFGYDDACPLDGFEVTSAWVGWYGGDVWGETGSEAIDDEILASDAYDGFEDDWIAGTELSAALFDDPAVVAWDARAAWGTAPVPTRFFMGRHDYDTPAPLVEAYDDAMDGDHAIVWFEDSAHFPFWEQPDAFLDALTALPDPR